MSHDFAKKGQAKKRSSPPKNARKQPPENKALPGWIWFIAGVIVTLFVQFLIHLASIDDKQDRASEAKQTTSNVEQKAEPKEKAKPKLQYRFYEELKQKQVNVNAEKVAEREQEDYSYALQAGAFKNKQDAEQMRAEIILLGLDARVEQRTSNKGTVWNRVIVGPFTSRSRLQQARSTLIDNNVPTMVFKHD